MLLYNLKDFSYKIEHNILCYFVDDSNEDDDFYTAATVIYKTSTALFKVKYKK